MMLSHTRQAPSLCGGKWLVAQSLVTLCNPMDYIAHKAPLSMKFSRQEYWSGLPCFLQGIFPTHGPNLASPALQAGSLPSEPPGKLSMGRKNN